MNGRFFDGRKLECFYWDGQTDYNKTIGSIDNNEKRLEEFGKYLDSMD